MLDFAIQIVPVTPFQQNCCLAFVESTKKGVVIDPGGDVPLIRAAIDKAGLTIERILITHGHVDHIGGAAELRDALGVEIVGPHQADAPIFDSLLATAARYGIADVRAVTPDRWLAEGDTVLIGDVAFDVLHCPGHAPGHVVYASPALRFAFVGDVLFAGSVGRTDLPLGDHDTLIASIKTKLFPLGDEVAFVCGHGPGSTIGEERLTNPFLR